MSPDFVLESGFWEKGAICVAGLDEVGRGCFAGPIVTGCVVFTKQIYDSGFENQGRVKIDDSKKLTAKQRKEADKWIREHAQVVSLGTATVVEINRFGIGKATNMAFRRAIVIANRKLEVGRMKHDVDNRNRKTDCRSLLNDNQSSLQNSEIFLHPSGIERLLIDAFYIPRVKGLSKDKQLPVIRGDGKSLSIAAASIAAKVYRDSLMEKLSKESGFCVYGWDKNKGYGTREHREAILRHGISQHHRTVFVETWMKKAII